LNDDGVVPPPPPPLPLDDFVGDDDDCEGPVVVVAATIRITSSTGDEEGEPTSCSAWIDGVVIAQGAVGVGVGVVVVEDGLLGGVLMNSAKLAFLLLGCNGDACGNATFAIGDVAHGGD